MRNYGLLALAAVMAIGLFSAWDEQAPASLNGVVGTARIIDGDTLHLAGERIRLEGIDAPEARQQCRADGWSYACGEEATSYLESLLEGGAVRCYGFGQDSYGRTLGVCYQDGHDLNAAMVEAGWALAYRRFSTAYVSEEGVARRDRRGLWRGEFVAPWDWRQGTRLDSD